jgi:signal peptidase I
MKQSKFLEYTKAIVTALILALIIRAFVVQAFKIPSGSMLPTLLIGDHILVNKFIYGTKIPLTDKRILQFTKPQRGDIVVFKYPEDPDRDFIKRIVAVEGDIIGGMNKKVVLNREILKEPYAQYIDDSNKIGDIQQRDNFGPYIVPKGKVFVMGDNRDQSYDSRFWGYVDIKDIKGKAFIIYWSWDNTKKLPRLKRMGKLIY